MSDPKTRDFDEITSFLGVYGIFQNLVIAVVTASAAVCGWTSMLAVFVADTPEHRCNASSNSTRTDVESGGGGGGAGSCFRVNASGSGAERCVEGWVFSTERYSSTIVTEWDLVCDDSWKVPFSTSMFFVGVLIGSFSTGQLSDRLGRKPVFFFTMALLTVIPLIQASSFNWVMYCVLNGLRGLGVANYIVSLILGSEMLSQQARVTCSLLGHCTGFGVGYALLPLFAYFIRGWRMLLVATAIPGFLFIPAWWLIPESPRWLLQKGRVEEAELVIRIAAKRNRVPTPEAIFRTDECLELMHSKGEEEQAYTYLDLIRTPNIRNITILSIFIWMSTSMVFYGLSLNTSTMNGDAYLNCLISAVIDIVVYVATWALAKRVPRPTLLFSTLMFCGVMLLIIKLVPEDMHVMIQVLVFVGKVGVSAAYALIYVFFTELIPTVVRNMGLGIASTAARAGNIISPFMIYIGIYSKILPYIVFGTISILAAAATMLLPDTRNSKLPDLISEAKPIRGCCSKMELLQPRPEEECKA